MKTDLPLKSLGFNIDIPSDVMSEQSLIASVLLGGVKLFRNLSSIDKSMFYRIGHTLIWEAYGTIEKAGQEIDIVTLNEELTKRNALEPCGGLAYIMQCAELLPSTSNYNSYAKLVREYHQRREIIFASEYASKKASVGDTDVDAILVDLNKTLTFSGNTTTSDGLSDLIDNVIDIAINRECDDKQFSVPSGFMDIDEITGGWRDGELIVLGGRPSMGKSSLGLQYVWNASEFFRQEQLKSGVLLISAEMSKDMVTTRMLSIYSEMDSNVIQTKKLTEYQKHMLIEVRKANKMKNVKVVADKTVTLSSIRDAARDMQRSMSVGLIVVDYLQMIALPSSYKSENRTRDIGVISRGLKDIAREFNCPVIALSSLSRAVEQRQDKRPMMSDLRESGDIESDADVIQFIYRAGYYEKHQAGEEESDMDKAEIITAKNRNGRTGVSLLDFKPRYAKFYQFSMSSFDL